MRRRIFDDNVRYTKICLNVLDLGFVQRLFVYACCAQTIYVYFSNSGPTTNARIQIECKKTQTYMYTEGATRKYTYFYMSYLSLLLRADRQDDEHHRCCLGSTGDGVIGYSW